MTVDIPAPRDHAIRTDGRADTPWVYNLGAGTTFSDGSWIGYLELDLTDFPRGEGLAYPVSANYGVSGITIDTLVMKNPPRLSTQSLYFGAGSENITVHELFFEQNVNAGDAQGDGGCSQFHNMASRVDYFHITMTGPDFANFREGYTGGFTFGEVVIDFPGRFNGSLTDQFYHAGVRFSLSISESRPLVVGTLRYTSPFDLDVDLTDPEGTSDDGFWGAGALTGSELPIIERFESNKDWKALGCTPLYVSTKSVEGPLTYDTRHYEFPAAPAATDLTLDYEAGRVYLQEVYLNFGPDNAGWDFFIYTPPFVDNRGVVDRGVYPTHYNITGGFAADNAAPVAQWNQFSGPGYLSNVGQSNLNQTYDGSFDRHFRYVGYNGEAAGNYMKMQYAYYPMKSLFVERNG